MPKLAFAAIIAAVFIALLLPLQGPAVAGHPEVLVAECHKQLKLGDSGCACVGERARELLSDRQQALVVAMVTRNKARGAELQARLSPEEQTGAAKFMTETPGICAGK